MSPTSGTNQPSTTTSVRLGDWRRAESFMIQMAIQSQMAIPISIGIIEPTDTRRNARGCFVAYLGRCGGSVWRRILRKQGYSS